MAQAILQILEQPEYANILAQRGLARVANYTWDGLAEQMESVYERVLAKKRNR
jgi:glycosyltransferase involved in cell wall biosynthesis